MEERMMEVLVFDCLHISGVGNVVLGTDCMRHLSNKLWNLDLFRIHLLHQKPSVTSTGSQLGLFEFAPHWLPQSKRALLQHHMVAVNDATVFLQRSGEDMSTLSIPQHLHTVGNSPMHIEHFFCSQKIHFCDVS